jgi:hypothetical protein
VRGKIMKNVLITSLIAAMLATTFAITPAFAEGMMFVNPTIDPSYVPTTTFSKDVWVMNVMGLLAYEMHLTYDPTIIQAIGYEAYAPLNEYIYASIDIPGEVIMFYSFELPELIGLDTNDPFVVGRIGFLVLDYGVSELVLHDVKMVDVSGNEFTTLGDSVFSNVWPTTVMPEDVYVGLTGSFLGDRNFDVSKDGTIQTIAGQMENKGMYQTKALVKSRVLNSMGMPVADLTSSAVQIMPGGITRLSMDLDVTTLDMPASYIVEVHIEYVGFTGWIVGRHGAANAAKTMQTLHFTLEA